jgi:hypothetical protein
MKTISFILLLLHTGMLSAQTFENPLPGLVYYRDHEFEKWYSYVSVDERYAGSQDTVKYILFRTRARWKDYEKQFMIDQNIKPVYRVSRKSSPHLSYYHLPWGHSMISHEQYYIVDQKTGCGIEYRPFSKL